MIAILLAPFYVLANIYIVRWLIKWTYACSNIFKNKVVRNIIILLYVFFASSFIIGFFLQVRFIKIIGNYWLGVVQYILLTILIADLIRIIIKKFKLVSNKVIESKKVFAIIGLICLTTVFSLSTYGVLHAKKIVYTNYSIKINKKVDNIKKLKISLVSDLHLGYNSSLNHVKKMVKMINDSNSDLVVMAGDIFDNNYSSISKPKEVISELKKIKSKYGVYTVCGNHDIDEKILAGFTFSFKKGKKLIDSKMEEFLKDANVKLLRDETVLIDNSFYLIGRLDYHKYGIEVDKRQSIKSLTKNVDKSKPIIVLDHEPYELDVLSTNGVDLDLSGHTHNGQMFPSNLFIKMVWKNAYGKLKVGNMYSIVTSGIGVYGPNMRVLTTEEVANINVYFK